MPESHDTAADVRYPIGRWHTPDADPATLRALVEEVADAPARLRAAVAGLDAAQLDTPYRDGGWTVRQLVHHVADSHMNAYVRFKKALTEPGAPIVPYDEARWAELPDSAMAPDVSLALLDALHARWAVQLRALCPAEYEQSYTHPEMGPVTLRTALGIYAWHGRHHTAHVTELRRREGW